MEVVNVLFIDDQDLTANIRRIKATLKNNGFQLNEKVFNVADAAFQVKIDGQIELNVDKVQKYFIDNYFNVDFDVVACDFNFSYDNYDGYKLLTWLINLANNNRPKGKIRLAKFAFYTAQTEYFSDIVSNDVEKLLRLKIEKLIDRTQLIHELPKLIIDTKREVNLLKEFQLILEDHSDLAFKGVYPDFKGKTLGDIFYEIENETPHGLRYQKVLLEQAISHMVDLQKD